MSADVCVTNLGPRGRRQRFAIALVMGLVVVGALVLLVTQDVGQIWRLLLFVPLFVGGLGLFQAMAGT